MNDYLLKGKKVLITAGPTREPIDPVRYISNHAGGKIGYELAAFMLQQGAQVFLVSGPVKVDLSHPMLTVVKVTTGCEMYLACCRFFEEADIAIFAAAVSDYKPKVMSSKKLLKEEDAFSIKMVKNIDVAGAFTKLKKSNQLTIGFAMESNGNTEQAIAKLDKKNFDLLVLNTLSEEEEGYGIDINCISLVKKDHSIEALAVKPRSFIVKDIITTISGMLKQKQSKSIGLYHHTHTANQTIQSLPA